MSSTTSFFGGTNGKKLKLGIDIEIVSTDYNALQKTLKIKYFLTTAKGFNVPKKEISFSISGEIKDEFTFKSGIASGKTVTVKETTITVQHDDRGFKDLILNISAKANHTGLTSSSIKINSPLKRVVRSGVFYFDREMVFLTNHNFSLLNINDDYERVINIQYLGETVNLVPKTKGEIRFSWTPPLYWEQKTTTDKGEAKIIFKVYEDNKVIEEFVSTAALIVRPDLVDFAPLVTLSEEYEPLKQISSSNEFVSILSKIRVNIDYNETTGVNGNDGPSGYIIECPELDKTYTEGNFLIENLNFVGDFTMTVYTVDKRGRKSRPSVKKIKMHEYFPPQFSFEAVRTRQDKTVIQAIRNIKVAPLNIGGQQHNFIDLSFKVSEVGSNVVQVIQNASQTYKSTSEFVESGINFDGTFPSNKAFKVVGTLRDIFGSLSFESTVSPETVVMAYNKNSSVSIGKILEGDTGEGNLYVAGDIYSGDKKVMVQGDTRKLLWSGSLNPGQTATLSEPLTKFSIVKLRYNVIGVDAYKEFPADNLSQSIREVNISDGNASFIAVYEARIEKVSNTEIKYSGQSSFLQKGTSVSNDGNVIKITEVIGIY